ncbi:unnamed protein product [Oikopleura dioica]|uniref:Uncharacterized protein n=1 Tax=Oikopleura dioica TaxID=34765 RepID=E4Y7I4_OIKDI|nr:unnamed protein product [Oikopleura dioica]
MTITLAERERIIKKMDEQFESDLRMRKESNLCGQKAASTYKQLSLLQKEMRDTGSHVMDLKDQARQNARNIEAILNRADMKMFD